MCSSDLKSTKGPKDSVAEGFFTMSAPRFLTLSDVAEELQVSLSQVRALVRSGELPAIQIGGRNQWRIERTRFEEYINERHEQTLEAIASGKMTKIKAN